MRRAVIALLMLAGALVAPASSAAFPVMSFENQCRYSYDPYWRPVPIVFSGKLTDEAGTELASDSSLSVGKKLVLRDGTVSAVMPAWILQFGFDAGMFGLGDTDLPVRAWLALEATNTAEGVVAPIALNTVARAHVELTAAGQVDETRSSLTVIGATVPTQTWTATGGEVQVRQAVGESLPPIPVGRDGGDVRVRGSLFIEATLAGDLKLFMDCLQGTQVDQGETFADLLPGALSTFAVPGWTGAVDGTPLADPVDADVVLGRVPPRVGSGQDVDFSGAALRLRLTAAQRSAWLAAGGSATVTGGVVVHGARSVEDAQTVPLTRAVTVPADGPATLSLPLSASTWTAAGGEGIDLRADRVISLEANVGGTTRTLTLTRVTAGDGYPFARLLREADPPTPIVRVTPTPTAPATPVPTLAPAPTATPVPAPVPGKAAVSSTKLKVTSSRVAVSVRCAGETACRGTVRLRSAAKVRIGKRSKVVTLTSSKAYSLPAGQSASLKLTLSKDGRSVLKARRSLKVAVELRPAGGKVAVRQLTLRR
jgi:hypothetical protein